jgi:GntR family transcriptional regulator, transcriptional repressor for pyruvate dehydrogenase complex
MSAAQPSAVIFAPVARAAVSDDVYRQLRDAILSGALPAGAALSGERVLAEQFEVNRHAVREAMRRLEQARLVEVSHGGSTRVLDWRTHAGLELLSEVSSTGDLAALSMLRSVVEMRLAVGVDAARLAAQRISDTAGDELADHVERIRSQSPAPELAALGDSYDVLWRLIVAASDNIAYQLSDNTLVEALHRFPDLALQLSGSEITDLDRQRDLVMAIRAHDDALAADTAHDLLQRMVVEGERVVAAANVEPLGSPR